MSSQDTPQQARDKEEFIEALEEFKGDKKKAAASLNINLVSVRSWRHKDTAFNAIYKRLVIGSEQSKVKADLKPQFIQLLHNGLSQRQACEELSISIVTLRTWKKVDQDFKRECLKARFGD